MSNLPNRRLHFRQEQIIDGKKVLVSRLPQTPFELLLEEIAAETAENKLDRETQPGLIYFLLNPKLQHVKIGFTTKKERRFSTIQSSNSIKLKVLVVIEGNRQTESDLLNKFADYRVSGEWFIFSQEIQDYVKCIQEK